MSCTLAPMFAIHRVPSARCSCTFAGYQRAWPSARFAFSHVPLFWRNSVDLSVFVPFKLAVQRTHCLADALDGARHLKLNTERRAVHSSIRLLHMLSAEYPDTAWSWCPSDQPPACLHPLADLLHALPSTVATVLQQRLLAVPVTCGACFVCAAGYLNAQCSSGAPISDGSAHRHDDHAGLRDHTRVCHGAVVASARPVPLVAPHHSVASKHCRHRPCDVTEARAAAGRSAGGTLACASALGQHCKQQALGRCGHSGSRKQS